MQNSKNLIIGIIALVLIIILAVFFYHPKRETTKSQESIQTVTSTTNDGSDLYTLSPAERDNFLFIGNQNKDYQFVVDATNDGIQNHKDLIWDDINFWNHRGMALYSLGHCADAGAAFYHVLMRAPNDDIASNFLATILHDKRCDTATSSNDVK